MPQTAASTAAPPPDADEEEALKASIEALPGIGPAVARKALAAFGSLSALKGAAERGAVDEIAQVPGLGPQRASALVQALRGADASTLLATPRTQDVLQRIRDTIGARTRTKAGRNEIALLGPLDSRKRRDAHIQAALAARDELNGLDLEAARSALDHITTLPPPPAAFESGVVIFVDCTADRDALLEAGLDRWADIAGVRDVDAAHGAEVAVYAYSDGGAALEDADHCVPVPFTTDPAVLAPWSVTERFRKARATLEASAALSRLRGRPSAADKALQIVASLPAAAAPIDKIRLEADARKALERALADAEKSLAGLTLTGADLVRALRSEAPAAVRELYAEAMARAQAEVTAATGCDVPLFATGVPPEVDLEAVAEAATTWGRSRAVARHRAYQAAAAQLVRLTADVEAEIAEHLAFDARQAIGSFVADHGLVAPEWGEGFLLRGALHLDFAQAGERIDYRLGLDDDGAVDGDRVALLTGANSGGKTTLLETIAQVALLAHCGLPVPAHRAVVPELDAIHFFAERRSLSAGAFEAFLRRLFPIANSKGRVLVLADELEAMTELEAAAEIIAAFLDLLSERDAFALVVTHMAPHVAPCARRALRIDGIEARGLDADGRLIVDRSPVIGKVARSTPELILRRLATKGPEELRPVFGDLADRLARRFRDDTPGAAMKKKRTRRAE